jgi:hypothetical protein
MGADYLELTGYFVLMWTGGFTVSLKILAFKRFSEVIV